MIIFVIPGFSSHNPNRKFDVLKKYLPTCQIVGLTYTSNDPHIIANSFHTSVKNAIKYYDDEDIVFLGTSLGGFWSIWLSEIFNSKRIIINPALDPQSSLTNHIGLNKNCYTNDIMSLTNQNVFDYNDYYDKSNLPTLILLDEGDELFDSNQAIHHFARFDNSQIRMFIGGNHAFQHLKESLPFIKDFIDIQ